MSEIKLGQLIDGKAERDAIHVAVVPVMADAWLNPGTHVGIVDLGPPILVSDKAHPCVGVISPFLLDQVAAGEECWLLLYPNTVTNIRHAWTHPKFDNPRPREQQPTKDESEEWLRSFVRHSDCPDYDTLLVAATGGHLESVDPEWYPTPYRVDGEYLYFGGRDAHGDIPPEFWEHVENVTGKPCPVRPKYFTCSC